MLTASALLQFYMACSTIFIHFQHLVLKAWTALAHTLETSWNPSEASFLFLHALRQGQSEIWGSRCIMMTRIVPPIWGIDKNLHALRSLTNQGFWQASDLGLIGQGDGNVVSLCFSCKWHQGAGLWMTLTSRAPTAATLSKTLWRKECSEYLARTNLPLSWFAREVLHSCLH